MLGWCCQGAPKQDAVRPAQYGQRNYTHHWKWRSFSEDFETLDDTGWFSGWRPAPLLRQGHLRTPDFEVETENCRIGASCIRLSAAQEDVGETSGSITLSEYAPLDSGGEEYVASFWVRGDVQAKTDYHQAYLLLVSRSHDERGAVTTSTTETLSADIVCSNWSACFEWTHVVRRFRLAPEHTDAALVLVGEHFQGTIRMDGITIMAAEDYASSLSHLLERFTPSLTMQPPPMAPIDGPSA